MSSTHSSCSNSHHQPALALVAVMRWHTPTTHHHPCNDTDRSLLTTRSSLSHGNSMLWISLSTSLEVTLYLTATSCNSLRHDSTCESNPSIRRYDFMCMLACVKSFNQSERQDNILTCQATKTESRATFYRSRVARALQVLLIGV